MTHPEHAIHIDRACEALRMYVERGEQALAALREERPLSEFFRLLRRRDAAFHNFQALDAIAKSCGLDVADQPLAQDLWRRVGPLNGQLACLMETSRGRLAGSLKRLGDGSQMLRAYGAARPPEERLRKSV